MEWIKLTLQARKPLRPGCVSQCKFVLLRESRIWIQNPNTNLNLNLAARGAFVVRECLSMRAFVRVSFCLFVRRAVGRWIGRSVSLRCLHSPRTSEPANLSACADECASHAAAGRSEKCERGALASVREKCGACEFVWL